MKTACWACRACDGGQNENADGAPSPDLLLSDPRIAKRVAENAPEQVGAGTRCRLLLRELSRQIATPCAVFSVLTMSCCCPCSCT